MPCSAEQGEAGELSLEEEPIRRRTDRRNFAGVRGRPGHGEVVPEARRQPTDFLPLEVEVRRTAGERSAAAEAVGSREPQAEASGRRSDAGQAGFALGSRFADCTAVHFCHFGDYDYEL